MTAVLAQVGELFALMMQLRAAAVSWRASCRWLCPTTLTHSASTADAASLGASVSFVLLSRMHSPHTLIEPPAMAITAPVMSWLQAFPGSVSACVPQNPGVRQIRLH